MAKLWGRPVHGVLILAKGGGRGGGGGPGPLGPMLDPPWIVLLAAVLAMPVASTKYFLKGTKESNVLSGHSDLDGGSVVVQRYLDWKMRLASARKALPWVASDIYITIHKWKKNYTILSWSAYFSFCDV